jgi:hypothetical protein
VPIRNQHGKQGKTGRAGWRWNGWDGAQGSTAAGRGRPDPGSGPRDRSSEPHRPRPAGRAASSTGERGGGAGIPVPGCVAGHGRVGAPGAPHRVGGGGKDNHTRHAASLRRSSRCVPTPGPGRPRAGDSPACRYGVQTVTVPVIMTLRPRANARRMPQTDARGNMKNICRLSVTARSEGVGDRHVAPCAPRLRR